MAKRTKKEINKYAREKYNNNKETNKDKNLMFIKSLHKRGICYAEYNFVSSKIYAQNKKLKKLIKELKDHEGSTYGKKIYKLINITLDRLEIYKEMRNKVIQNKK